VLQYFTCEFVLVHADGLSFSTAATRVQLSFLSVPRITCRQGTTSDSHTPVLRASVSTLLISSRGAHGVKRKPGHWCSILTPADSHVVFFFSVGGWRIGRGSLPIPSNEDQLLGKLNLALTNDWSADCVRLTVSLAGSCLHEYNKVWACCHTLVILYGSPQGRALLSCGGSTRSLLHGLAMAEV
jgi:hypothetical protein